MRSVLERRIYFLVLLTMILSLFFPIHVEACSRIFWNNKINKIVARTMDLSIDESPSIAILPRGLEKEGHAGPHSIKWISKYGSIVATAFNNEAVSEGMNEKGFSAHVLCLEGTQYESRDSRPGLSNAHWISYFLDNFSSVGEALESLNSFQVISSKIGGRYWSLHASLQDSFGDSAIIEYIDGEIKVYHDQQHLVLTNEPSYDKQLKNLHYYKAFGGKLALPGGTDSKSRFVRSTAFLKGLPEPKNLEESISHIVSVIRTIQVPFGKTRWMSLMDMTYLTYYFNSIFTLNFFSVELKNLDFSSEQSIKTIDPHHPSLNGEISHQFIR